MAKNSPHTTTETMKVDNVVIVGVVVLLLIAVYLLDPTFFGLFGKRYDGFEDASTPNLIPNQGKKDTTSTGQQMQSMDVDGAMQKMAEMSNPNVAGTGSASGSSASGFADYESGPADFGNATAPAGCYPRDQLTATELLPKDANSVWAQQNPLGPGSLKGKNFLSAGALVGINTVGQSMKNANLQLRSEPPNPQVPISIFNNSTIEPDFNRRPLEIN
jgi:hypothetical protein